MKNKNEYNSIEKWLGEAGFWISEVADHYIDDDSKVHYEKHIQRMLDAIEAAISFFRKLKDELEYDEDINDGVENEENKKSNDGQLYGDF